MAVQTERHAIYARVELAMAAGDWRAAKSLLGYLLRCDPEDHMARAKLAELESQRHSSLLRPPGSRCRDHTGLRSMSLVAALLILAILLLALVLPGDVSMASREARSQSLIAQPSAASAMAKEATWRI